MVDSKDLDQMNELGQTLIQMNGLDGL